MVSGISVFIKLVSVGEEGEELKGISTRGGLEVSDKGFNIEDIIDDVWGVRTDAWVWAGGEEGLHRADGRRRSRESFIFGAGAEELDFGRMETRQPRD
jgi:hypothetical protein